MLPRKICEKAGEGLMKLQNYNHYSFENREKILYVVEGILMLLVVAYTFYQSVWAMLPLGIVLPFFLKEVQKTLCTKQKERLTLEFKELLQLLMANLQAGYSVENAFKEAQKDYTATYGGNTYLSKELSVIKRGLENNIMLEQLLSNIGERSGVEEIKDFSEIFSIAKKSGGDLNQIMRTIAHTISDKIDVKGEIQTMMSAKKLEQKIMSVIPIFIILYVSITSSEFLAVLYHNSVGIIIMTICLIIYGAAIYLAGRIVDIQI